MTDRLLSEEEINRGLTGSSWRHEGDAIVREDELADFSAVIDAVNRVAEAAQKSNHHPDILVHDWNQLRLTLSTHSAGGITAEDLALAKELDALL